MTDKIKSIFRRVKTPKNINKVTLKLLVYGLLIGISYIYIYPIIRMISTSLFSLQDLINPEVVWIPRKLNFQNYQVANRVIGLLPPSLTNAELGFFGKIFGIFKDPGNLYKSIRNVFFLAGIQTVISALTGYAFARYEFRFKKILFAMVLISFVIPLPMVTIPRYMMLSSFQEQIWINSLGKIPFLPNTIFQSLVPQLTFTLFGQGINSAILILIFYNFYKMIPKALEEAAVIDGASTFQVFWHIYIKLVVPIIITVFLLSFIWNWNDVYSATIFYSANNPLIVLRLSLFDANFAGSAGSVAGDIAELRINESYKMAATFISILPLIILYVFAQTKFIEGIERTGLTGE